MSTSRRSATGCTPCKTSLRANRRKKCDETKPRCLRCLGTGNTCYYEYVEHPKSDKNLVTRTKPAPRNARELSTEASQNVSTRHRGAFPVSPFVSQDSGGSFKLTCSIILDHHGSRGEILPGFGLGVPRGPTGSGLIPPSSTSLDPLRLPAQVQHRNDIIPAPSSSASRVIISLDTDEGSKDDDDPEGIRVLLYMAPTMDNNVKENTLPFVLQCYSQWAIAGIFEPLRVVHTIKHQVIAQFSSENTRTRAILIANVMNMCTKNLAVDDAIIDHLALNVRKSGDTFMSRSPSLVPALDRQNAIRVLDNTIEILTLHVYVRPTHDYVRLLESAAPIFRRACIEPAGRPINLPAILFDLNLNLRNFATMDILQSIVTGLPTCFQYEVPFSLELCDRIYEWQLQGNYGLQWLYGLPDQFIMLFAWINTMSETEGACDNSELVGWIEKVLPQIKIATDTSDDPTLGIGRMAVLESWRLVVRIYLFMVLGKADAHDPRVTQVHNGFMRIFRNIKPGRHPDLYFGLQIGVAGIATTKERHQEVLRRRVLGLREYAQPGTALNDMMLILEDIWARTRDEGRAAVWADRRIAYSKVRGRVKDRE